MQYAIPIISSHTHKNTNNSINHLYSKTKKNMLSSTLLRRTAATLSSSRSFMPLVTRTMATGPAAGGEISDDLLAKLGSLSTQALVDGLWVMGWPNAQIDGTRALHPSHKCVGRAVTLQFVPARPDIAQDKPAGGESPEYEAFEKCGPNEVRGIYVMYIGTF